MKKRILAALIAAASVLSLAGCNNETKPNDSGSGNSGSGNSGSGASTPAPTVTDTDDTLSVLAWSGHGDMPSLISYFCETTGTPKEKVKWVQLGAKGEDARVEYKKYIESNAGDADIIICDNEWSLEYANDSRYTVPLSAIGLDKSAFADAYAYTLEIGTNKNGDLVGATYQAAPGGYLYDAVRAEELLGVKNPTEMQALVSDWTKFEETAKKLAEQGVAICASEGDLWQVYQCQRTTKWVENGKLVADDFIKNFAQMAKDYADKGYITKEEQWKDGWTASVPSGKALGGFASTWGLLNNGAGTIAENWAGGKDVKGRLGLCEGPSGYYWGGSFMEVAVNCNSSSLAKKWIETFCVNADTMEGYARKTGDFVNNKKVMEKLSKDTTLKNELFKDGTHQFTVLYKAADNIKVLVTEYDGALKQKFNVAVQDYAIKGTTKSLDDCIKAFTDSVAKDYADLV